MINTSRLRAMLGWLGMLLPWIVVLLHQSIPPSISSTYYDDTCITPFMIILGSAGLLLISYKGYDLLDDLICTAAGIFALGICLFPCAHGSDRQALVGTFSINMNTSSTLHNVCAIAFFGLLAFNSFFLFTKSSGDMTPEKKKRNIIFRVCGVGMLASFSLMLLPWFYIKVWLVELVALVFFGISWLTKANIYPWLFSEDEYRQVDDDSI